MNISHEDRVRARVIFDAVEKPLRKLALFSYYTNTGSYDRPIIPNKGPFMLSYLGVKMPQNETGVVRVFFDRAMPYKEVVVALKEITQEIEKQAIKSEYFEEEDYDSDVPETSEYRISMLRRDDYQGLIPKCKEWVSTMLKQLESNLREVKRPSKEFLEQIFKEVTYRMDHDQEYINDLKLKIENT